MTGAPPLPPRPSSCGTATPPSRPLHDKLASLLQLLLVALREVWGGGGGSSEAALTQRMLKMASALSGGIINQT